MLHYWKSAKRKLAYDTVSGAVLSLSSLEYKMLQAITPPLSAACPSSLRYELAKFDSADVEEAYDRLYALYQEGLILSESHTDTPSLRIGKPYGITETGDLLREIADRLNGTLPTLICLTDADNDTVDSIREFFQI